jgi:hypothetical protein
MQSNQVPLQLVFVVAVQQHLVSQLLAPVQVLPLVLLFSVMTTTKTTRGYEDYDFFLAFLHKY